MSHLGVIEYRLIAFGIGSKHSFVSMRSLSTHDRKASCYSAGALQHVILRTLISSARFISLIHQLISSAYMLCILEIAEYKKIVEHCC